MKIHVSLVFCFENVSVIGANCKYVTTPLKKNRQISFNEGTLNKESGNRLELAYILDEKVYTVQQQDKNIDIFTARQLEKIKQINLFIYTERGEKKN